MPLLKTSKSYVCNHVCSVGTHRDFRISTFCKAMAIIFAMLITVPLGLKAAQPDGYYIQGNGFDGNSDTYLHYKMKKVTGTTNQYYIDILGTTYTLAGVHSFGRYDISDNENLWINPLGHSFNVVRVSGGNKTYYGTSGDNYTFTNNDPNYGTSNTAYSNVTLGNNLWKIGTADGNGDNGGMYHFVITVDENGAVTSWQYTSDPKKVVAYKLGDTSWTTDDYLYCSRVNTTEGGNYKGYNQNFSGSATCYKDKEFAFLIGDVWFKANENKSSKTYTKNTATWISEGNATSSGTQENLKFEYTDGAYAMQFNPTQDEYQLWGGNGGGTDKPTKIYIIGNAVGTDNGSTFTSWGYKNAIELIYDTEEGCWKGTVPFTAAADNAFRFLYNRDDYMLEMNLGEDSNTPGNGGDTWQNNKVSFNTTSTTGTNIGFTGTNGETTGTYTVRFYMEAAEGKRFQDARTYWYTLTSDQTTPSIALTPGSTTFSAGTTEQALTATESNAEQYAWVAYTGNNTMDVDATSNLTTYTEGNGNFGTLKYENGNIYLVKNGESTLLVSGTNTVTIAVSPVKDGALSGATQTYTYTFTVSGGSTNVGTISPDGGFYVNKVQVTITPETGKTIYYALGGKQASASTSEAITAATKVWVSTPGAISISDGTNTQVSKDFDFTYSTSDNYLNYYHNGSSSQVVNTGGGKDAITVFFQTYNNDTHVYAWDYSKDAWYKGEQGSQNAIDGKYVALTSFIPGAALMDVNKTTLNGMTFYYFTTLKSSLTTYTDTKYGDLTQPAVSFLANRGLNVDGKTNIVEAYKTADEANIQANNFYVYNSSAANSVNGVDVTTYNNSLAMMDVHYGSECTSKTLTDLVSKNSNIVFFYKPSTWSTAYCYSNNTNANWPGNQMTLVPGTSNLYYVNVGTVETDQKLIFSDNGNNTNRTTPDNQAGYVYTAGGYYATDLGVGMGACDVYSEKHAANSTTISNTLNTTDNAGKNIVFFYKPNSWTGTLKCYAYGSENNTWPGGDMTQVGSTNIWYYTWSSDKAYTNVIFVDYKDNNVAHRSTPDNATGYVYKRGGYYVTGMGAGHDPSDLYLDAESAARYEKFINTAATSTVTSPFYPNGEDYYRNATGDQTLVLDPTWAKSTAVSTTSDADWSGRTTSYTDPNNSSVNDLPRKVTGNTAISQDVVSLDANSNYTVQAIVKGANVTLTLKSSEDGTDANTTTTTVTGTKPTSGSFVTKSGRIEKLEPTTNRQEGWYKVEATAKPATNGLLNISLQGDGEFYLADVTLLKNANTAVAGNMWTTAPLTNENTYVSYAVRETHNAFSFFDRGENPNGLVAVDDHAVIANAGTYLPETVVYKSKVTGTPYNIIGINNTANEKAVCNELYLTEQAQDGTMNTGFKNTDAFFASSWTFGTPVTFKATKVTFDRLVPNQKSTMVMPFELTTTDLEKFNKTYTFKGVEDGKVKFTENSAAIAANTPFVVEGKATAQSTSADYLTFEDKTIAITSSATPTAEGKDGSSFTGEFTHVAGIAQTEKVNGDEYINYAFDAATGNFLVYSTSTAANMGKIFRAYLHYKYPEGSKAKRAMPMVIDEEATAISDINSTVETIDGPVYSVNGMRVADSLNAASLPKGVYIHNGKKFIVK